MLKGTTLASFRIRYELMNSMYPKDEDKRASAPSLFGRFTAAVSQFANKHGVYMGKRATRLHVFVYRRSHGRIGGHLPGWPMVQIVLVDHIGARSGIRRVSPLIYHRDGDSIAVVASKGGQATNPAWFHNLIAHPATAIQIGSDTYGVCARVVAGAERDRLWAEFVALFPGYEFFREHAEGREIPIVVFDLEERAQRRGTT
jgi:F420H(2)-dependent quinone reductase